jgi:hypothetical protein
VLPFTSLKYVSVIFTQYYSSCPFEKNEMGKACSTNGGEERCIQDFGGET